MPGLWRDSHYVTCGLTACTPGSAPGPTLGNEYGKTLHFKLFCSVFEVGYVRWTGYLSCLRDVVVDSFHWPRGRHAPVTTERCVTSIVARCSRQFAVRRERVFSAGLMPTEARGNYLPEAPYLSETAKTYLNCI